MNPILLKPTSERRSQVVVRGRIWRDVDAFAYHRGRTAELFAIVCESYERLAERYDVVVLEGAGSPAEINLRDTDIVNMRMAHAADARCLLVGDIDRGGVFASLYGTIALLDDADRARIAGTIVNKFRGDLALFAPALSLLEEKTGRPCFGVVPYLHDIGLEEEDGLGLESVAIARRPAWSDAESPARRVRIAVVAWPAMANYTDFDALAREPSVELVYVDAPQALRGADLVVLPGTKSTLAALAWLEASGIAAALRGRAVPHVLGVCGGMQALGLGIDDPFGVEGGGSARGLGLLPLRTTLAREKICERVRGAIVADRFFGLAPAVRAIDGYEIHVGETAYEFGARPFAQVVRESDGRTLDDGAVSEDGSTLGTYLHGLFEDDAFRASFVAALRSARGLEPPQHYTAFRAEREARFDRLAAHVRDSIDVPRALGVLARA